MLRRASLERSILHYYILKNANEHFFWDVTKKTFLILCIRNKLLILKNNKNSYTSN